MQVCVPSYATSIFLIRQVCVFDCQFADDIVPGTLTDSECKDAPFGDGGVDE